jgi:hypothetical protein
MRFISTLLYGYQALTYGAIIVKEEGVSVVARAQQARLCHRPRLASRRCSQWSLD